MGKFNMDAIKKGRQQNTGSAGIYGNGTENNNSIKVGSALLDLGKAKEMETIYVKHEQIRPSADNKWSMNQEAIRQLADWIKDVGLLNHLILRDNETRDLYDCCRGKKIPCDWTFDSGRFMGSGKKDQST